MNRVAILHGNNTYNYGSLMMIVNFLHYMRQHTHETDIEFLIQCDSEDDFARIKNASNMYSGIRALYIRPRANKQTPITIAQSLYNKFVYSTYKILAHRPTAVVVLGGDNLSEYYSKSILVLELCKLAILSCRVPVILLGQTIGPFSSWRVFLARKVLQRFRIFLRDPISYRYSTQVLRISHSELSADMALLDLPGQAADAEAYRDFGLSCGEYVTVIPSGLVRHYARNFDVYVSSWVAVVRRMMELPELKNKKIVLLAHVLRPDACDDRKVIRNVHRAFVQMFPENKDQCVPITKELLPTQTRSILGNGCLTISGRMHGAVSSIQMGVPTICLSYSVKYQGVIGESLGMHDWIIEADDYVLWENGHIIDVLMRKIEDIIQKPTARGKIRERVRALQERLHAQMRSIANVLCAHHKIQSGTKPNGSNEK